jgi:hypothetical protein
MHHKKFSTLKTATLRTLPGSLDPRARKWVPQRAYHRPLGAPEEQYMPVSQPLP